MAEFVQQNVEEMLPELEQMERVGLFSGCETRKILKHRKAFEYKLRRRTHQKKDYLNYIQYENNVLALVKKRREKIGYTFKRIEIDVAIIKRIHRLFKHCCYRFQDDVNLWLSYVEFCKSRNEKSSVSRIFTRMLQVHNRNPELWVLAAKFEIEVVKSMENARNLLQRGIRFNTNCQKLWHEYFRMELINADKLRKRVELLDLANMKVDENKVVLDGHVAMLVYSKALENFPGDAKFVLGFLNICQQFDFTSPLVEKLLNDLKENFKHDAVTWTALAKHHLQPETQISQNSGLTKKQKSEEIEKLEAACFNVFKEAVTHIKTESIWDAFLEYCLERLYLKHDKSLIQQRLDCTLKVFEAAFTAQLLSVSMFLHWVSVLEKTGQVEKISEVINEATRRYPTSLPVWCKALNWVQQQEHDLVEATFDKAVASIPEKESLPLWECQLEWSIIFTPTQTESLLERGVSLTGDVGAHLKEAYLEWAAINKGVASARKLYKRLSAIRPHRLEFFLKYIKIETSQATPNLKRLRSAYEDAISEYGETETELWLNLAKLELKYGDPLKVGEIYWRAQKYLQPEFASRLEIEYSLFQSGHLS